MYESIEHTEKSAAIARERFIPNMQYSTNNAPGVLVELVRKVHVVLRDDGREPLRGVHRVRRVLIFVITWTAARQSTSSPPAREVYIIDVESVRYKVEHFAIVKHDAANDGTREASSSRFDPLPPPLQGPLADRLNELAGTSEDAQARLVMLFLPHRCATLGGATLSEIGRSPHEL